MRWPLWVRQPLERLLNRLEVKYAFDIDGRFNGAFPASTIVHLTQRATVTAVSSFGEEWLVKYQGSIWRARAPGGKLNLVPGDEVNVVARQSNVLFVEARNSRS